MLRLFIIAFLTYIAYVLLRKYLGPKKKDLPPQKRPEGYVDELVQDPVCKTYIPKATAFRAKIKGKEEFFCSRECAERYKLMKEEERAI